MTTKQIVSLCIVAVLVGGLIGYVFHPSSSTTTIYQPIVGATGDTQSSAKLTSIIVAGATSTATGATTTIATFYNNSDRDRLVKGIFLNLSPTNVQASTSLATWQIKAATSTAQYEILNSSLATSSNLLLSIDIASSTQSYYVASSSPGVTGLATATNQSYITRVWPAGTYINFKINAFSGTSYFNGIIGIEYYAQ